MLIDRLLTDVTVRSVDGGKTAAQRKSNRACSDTRESESSEFWSSEPFADIHVSLKVAAKETSSEVIAAGNPERTVWTAIGFDNVVIEWDERYQEDIAAAIRYSRTSIDGSVIESVDHSHC